MTDRQHIEDLIEYRLERPNRLAGLNQKVSGQVMVL